MTTTVDTDVEIYEWRRDVALELGATLDEAQQVGMLDFDLHKFADLVEQGCPVKTAIEILR